DISVPRTAGRAFWIAAVVFLAAYLAICFELLHRTIAAMLGAAIMLAVSYTIGTLKPECHIISFETAMHKIDLNVIFLLMGMMIIVGILKHTGVFQWCAYKCFHLARGSVFLLAVMFCIFTAVTSAFLDNVTTMLLLTPVTIAICQTLRLNPLTMLVPEVMASNVGGTATLIGDPPNIMIGSYAGLTFMDFVNNLIIVCATGLVILFFVVRLYYNRAYKEAQVVEVEAFTQRLREEYKITDGTLLGYGLFVLGFTIFLFITHGFWHMEVSVAALLGASVLFTYSILAKKVKMLELLEKDIEWPSLLFFMFLFMVVGAVEETGLLALIADWVLDLSKGNLTVAIVLILWVSAFLSAFVDNIPYTATMLPITAYLTQTIPGAESNVLWWALAFGACLGGNGTIIGASANVVTMGIAESVGYPISFVRFMKFGLVYMIISVAIANVWLLLYY
ncbi:MAG: SLC13 family permease, partial [Thermodesulfobacteriota bacterium]